MKEFYERILPIIPIYLDQWMWGFGNPLNDYLAGRYLRRGTLPMDEYIAAVNKANPTYFDDIKRMYKKK